MHWTERRRAKVNLAYALQARGWTLYGFHQDQSDAMTDYYHPASWDGVAEKEGYVVVVDISEGSRILQRSGGWKAARRVPGAPCPQCEGSGKQPSGWTFEQAQADPQGFHLNWGHGTPLLPHVVSPLHFDENGDQKCQQCHGAGHQWRIEETTVPWPTFAPNPPRRLWHVEKEASILDSGIGLGPCADWNRERAEAAVNAILTRIEGAIHAAHVEPCIEATALCAAGDATVRRNPAKNGIEVRFPAKPGEEFRDELKRLGFRWSRRQKLWYARYSPSLWEQVHELLDAPEPDESDLGSEPDRPKAVSDAADKEPIAPTLPPWQMTRLAYQQSRALRVAGGVPILNAKDGRDHEAAVRQAVAEGLPVPSHVLAAYGLDTTLPQPLADPSAAPQMALF